MECGEGFLALGKGMGVGLSEGREKRRGGRTFWYFEIGRN